MHDRRRERDDALGPQSALAKDRLVACSRMHFMFGGILMVTGNGIRAASVLGLALATWETAAMEALLAGCFILTIRSRTRLALIYSFASLLPLGSLIGVFVTQAQVPYPPNCNLIMLAGACGIVVNLLDAGMLSAFRAKGRSFGHGALQYLALTVPISLITVIAGAATQKAGTQTPDLVAGMAIALCQWGSLARFLAIAHLDVPGSAWGGDQIRTIVTRWQRLKLLTTPLWQAAATEVWTREQSRRANPS